MILRWNWRTTGETIVAIAIKGMQMLIAGTITMSLATPLLSAQGPSSAPTSKSVWTVLGSNAGPAERPDRSEPAHLLTLGNEKILIDCGDGAGQQLAKAGVSVRNIDAIVISHLHFDHTGGLYAILGMRFQLLTPGVLTIYGPPGTKRTVDGLIAAMQPETESGYGVPGEAKRHPEDFVRVVEVRDHDTFSLGAIKVTARRNSHYTYPPGSDDEAKFLSLSYRFDMQDRSLVYTGDTGPSVAVEELAQGADILFSEVMDAPATLEDLKRRYPDFSPAVMKLMAQHMFEQHLSVDALAELAKKAKVKEVVLIHNALTKDQVQHAIATLESVYGGKAVYAHDLDTF
jgi:ribonuclease BN (tRNA processing enzyme)